MVWRRWMTFYSELYAKCIVEKGAFWFGVLGFLVSGSDNSLSNFLAI